MSRNLEKLTKKQVPTANVFFLFFMMRMMSVLSVTFFCVDTQENCDNNCYSREFIDKLLKDRKMLEKANSERAQQLVSRKNVVKSAQDENKSLRSLRDELNV